MTVRTFSASFRQCSVCLDHRECSEAALAPEVIMVSVEGQPLEAFAVCGACLYNMRKPLIGQVDANDALMTSGERAAKTVREFIKNVEPGELLKLARKGSPHLFPEEPKMETSSTTHPRPRITGETSLAELQGLLEKARVRLHLCGTRLDELCNESVDGDLFFAVDGFATPGAPFPSRSGVAILMRDLASALDDALHCEIEKRSPVGLRLLGEAIEPGQVKIPDDALAPSAVRRRISIMIPEDVLARLRADAAVGGMDLQTLINCILQNATPHRYEED